MDEVVVVEGGGGGGGVVQGERLGACHVAGVSGADGGGTVCKQDSSAKALVSQ